MQGTPGTRRLIRAVLEPCGDLPGGAAHGAVLRRCGDRRIFHLQSARPMTSLKNPGDARDVFGRRFCFVAAGIIVGIFLVDVIMPPGLSLLPYCWIPVIFAATVASPRQVALLAGVTLGMDVLSGLRSDYFHSPGFPLRLFVSAAIAVAAGFIASRVQSRRAQARQREAALLNDRQHLTDLIGDMDIGTWEWNVQTGATVFSEAWAKIIGYRLAELQPVNIETWLNHVNTEDLLRSNEALQQCFNRQTDIYECEVRMRHRNGNWIWVLARGRVVEWGADGKPVRMLGTHRDVTGQVVARNRDEGEARVSLSFDVCSRVQFDAQGSQELLRVRESGARLSMMLVDVDRLGEINAALGREAGDAVLKSLAKACRLYLRGNDLLARFGGDRFALLLPDTPVTGAERVARRLVEALEQEEARLPDGRPVPFTVSVGAAEAVPGTDDFDALHARAADALERAKKDPLNPICAAG